VTGEGESEPSIDSLLREAAHIPAIAIEPDRIGQKLDRYRIDDKLGQGGMGIVYAAHDLELGRSVALKILPRAAVADDERRRRFLREARTAAAVSHPNLAAVFDVGEADGTVFLAMELVRGSSLRTRIAAAPHGLPLGDAVAIALQIARGLGKAHAAGVVHRDLKPENVMMDASGRVKIVDFGLAKPAAPEPRGEADLSTQEGRILGTPSYMAPEQAKGMRVHAAADVFSVGVVLYEMLTGQRPFVGASLVEVVVAIARDVPDAPSKKVAHVPRALDRIVLRCLAKDPGARFPDGDALADALEAPGILRARRGPWTWGALAAATLAIAATPSILSARRAGSATPLAAVASTAATGVAPVATDDPQAATPPEAASLTPASSAPPAPSSPAHASHGHVTTPARPGIAVEPTASVRPAAVGDGGRAVDPLARQK
jgi:serine/threonine-protein kinase